MKPNNPEQENKKLLLKAKNMVFRLLKIRLRSEKELADKLKRKGFPEDILEQTIQYFKDIGLINDREFTKGWIQSRLNKPYGKTRIFMELRRKGVSKEIIQSQYEEISRSYDELEIVENLARKRLRTYKGIDPKKQKQRLYGYLIRRGFSPYNVNKIIRGL